MHSAPHSTQQHSELVKDRKQEAKTEMKGPAKEEQTKDPHYAAHKPDSTYTP